MQRLQPDKKPNCPPPPADHDEAMDVAPQVLQLVVQHCLDLSSPADICSLLQVSTAVWSALQQSRGHCRVEVFGDIRLGTSAAKNRLAIKRLRVMAAWLPRYSGLVSGLTADDQHIRGLPEDPQAIMLAALQACAEAAATTATAGAPTTASAAGAGSSAYLGSPARAAQARHRGQPLRVALPCGGMKSPTLRLTSFHSTFIHPAWFQLLPAFHLQELHLSQMSLAGSRHIGCYSSAIASLTSLSRLCWELCTHDTLPNEIAEAIGQLPALKALTCKHLHVAAGQHLPASLRELSVGVLCERDLEGVGQQFDLGRLTDLASLRVSLPDYPSNVVLQLELPPGLRLGSLGLFGYSSGDLQLQRLLSVQHVQIDMHTGGRMLDLMHKLAPEPLLCLEASGTLFACPEDTKDITKALSKRTSLTRLDFDWVMVAGGEQVPWGASLAVLPLQHLQLGVSEASPTDLLHLSNLTALTSLHLNVFKGLDAATAANVVEPLTLLQGMSLQGDWPSLSEVVRPLAKLSQLRSLRLKCPYGVDLTAHDLRALAPLTRLSSLVVPLGSDCTPAVVQEWLDGVPCLDGISSS